MCLEPLEFGINPSRVVSLGETDQTIGKSLQNFSGLQDLYLLLETKEWRAIAKGAIDHTLMLKRLVLYLEEQGDCGGNWVEEGLSQGLVRANREFVECAVSPKLW